MRIITDPSDVFSGHALAGNAMDYESYQYPQMIDNIPQETIMIGENRKALLQSDLSSGGGNPTFKKSGNALM